MYPLLWHSMFVKQSSNNVQQQASLARIWVFTACTYIDGFWSRILRLICHVSRFVCALMCIFFQGIAPRPSKLFDCD